MNRKPCDELFQNVEDCALLLVPAPPGMGRQRPQNTQEDRGYHGDGRGYDPQHLPHIALYTPTKPVFTATMGVCRVVGGLLQPNRGRVRFFKKQSLAQRPDGITQLRFQKVSMRVLQASLTRKTTVHGHRERTLFLATTSSPYSD